MNAELYQETVLSRILVNDIKNENGDEYTVNLMMTKTDKFLAMRQKLQQICE